MLAANVTPQNTQKEDCGCGHDRSLATDASDLKDALDGAGGHPHCMLARTCSRR